MARPEGRALLASAARTATVSTDTQENLGHVGCHVVVEVTALAATPSVVVTIEGEDPAVPGEFYTILSGTAITDVTGTGRYVFKVGPGIAVSAGAAAADYLPARWRVTATHADTDSITYSVGVNLFPS